MMIGKERLKVDVERLNRKSTTTFIEMLMIKDLSLIYYNVKATYKCIRKQNSIIYNCIILI